MVENQNETKYYFSVAITSEDDNIILYFLNYSTNSSNFSIKELYEHELKCGLIPNPAEFKKYMPDSNPPFGKIIIKKLNLLNIILK